MNINVAVIGRESTGIPLHTAWWLGLPVGFYLFRYLVHILADSGLGLESWFLGELGIVENLTVVILAAALVLSIGALGRGRALPDPSLRVFLVIFSLGVLYFAGEEASWGQHWFGWQTGEFFQQVNDQRETNFHNTSVWLDRVPKSLLSLAIFIGGIVMPLYFHFAKKGHRLRTRFWWACPGLHCLPTAIIATTATWPSKIERFTGWHFYFDQAQEVKELFIAWFILLFILSLRARLHERFGNRQSIAIF
jgi:hypothetical protein